jgi:hypothetical protein
MLSVSTIIMPNEIKDLHTVDDTSFPYIFEQNATVPLKTSEGLVRCNVYRPKPSHEGEKFPVLVTYGPYGKDIHYKEYSSLPFHAHYTDTLPVFIPNRSRK